MGRGLTTTETRVDALARGFVAINETGVMDTTLFASDLFCDFNVPEWRYQVRSVEPFSHALLEAHPDGCTVRSWSATPTGTGFAIELELDFTEDGEPRYCRQAWFFEVDADVITAARLWCTGVWDQALVDRQAREAPILRS